MKETTVPGARFSFEEYEAEAEALPHILIQCRESSPEDGSAEVLFDLEYSGSLAPVRNTLEAALRAVEKKMSEEFNNLTEETYEEYSERTRAAISNETMERAAERVARVEAGAKALCRLLGEDWDDILGSDRRVYKGWAKAVLDAADETEGK